MFKFIKQLVVQTLIRTLLQRLLHLLNSLFHKWHFWYWHHLDYIQLHAANCKHRKTSNNRLWVWKLLYLIINSMVLTNTPPPINFSPKQSRRLTKISLTFNAFISIFIKRLWNHYKSRYFASVRVLFLF